MPPALIFTRSRGSWGGGDRGGGQERGERGLRTDSWESLMSLQRCCLLSRAPLSCSWTCLLFFQPQMFLGFWTLRGRIWRRRSGSECLVWVRSSVTSRSECIGLLFSLSIDETVFFNDARFVNLKKEKLYKIVKKSNNKKSSRFPEN